MTARHHLDALIRRWRSAVAVAVLCVLAAAALSLTATPTYQASAGLFFSLQYGNTANELNQGSTFTQNQMASYATLATTAAVLDPVIADLDLDTDARSLARRISATATDETVVLRITATSTSAAAAADIADSVAEQLTAAVDRLAPRNEEGGASVRSTLVAPAEEPRSPAAPNTRSNLVIGLLLGVLAGVGQALAREVLDNRVHDSREVAELSDLAVVGSIPTQTGRGTIASVVEQQPHGPAAEALRHLRTNLQFLDIPGDVPGGAARVLAVTSSKPGEGKSTVSIDLAVALAETGARVVLVDADLRRPTVAARLGLEEAAGLTTVLLGRATVADVVQDWGAGGLHVLTSGGLPPNPTELLGAPAMRRLLAELRESYDHVVVDTPPVLAVADPLVLSRAVDGTLLVASAGRVRRTEFSRAVAALGRVGAPVLGVVLNRVRRGEDMYGYGSHDGDASGSATRPDAPAPTILDSGVRLPAQPAPLPRAETGTGSGRGMDGSGPRGNRLRR